MKFCYNFLNGESVEIEISDEFAELLGEFERRERNSAAVQKRHCVSIESFNLKERVFISGEDPLTAFERKTVSLCISELSAQLSKTQLRRLNLYIDGLSMHEIAKMENVAYNAVYKSIIACKKLFSAKLPQMGGQNPCEKAI